MGKFWYDGSTEPKRSFRWYFSLAGAAGASKIETYAIKTVKKPSYAISEVPHQYGAHTFYYPGRITWNPVEITFVDPVQPDQSAVITNMLADAGYNLPTNDVVALRSFSKGGFIGAVGNPQITQVDAAGEPIEQWNLANAFFTSVDYGQLDYSSEELVILSLTLRYDFATFETFGSERNPESKLPPGSAGV